MNWIKVQCGFLSQISLKLYTQKVYFTQYLDSMKEAWEQTEVCDLINDVEFISGSKLTTCYSIL